MSRHHPAGTVLRLLCLPIAFAALASCGQHQQQQLQPQSPHKLTEGEEFQELLVAMKSNPSLQPGSKEAGPPIHVNPYPTSVGMNGRHAPHGMHHL